MRHLRRGLLGLIALAPACGGGPTTPSPPPAFVLLAGPHTLNVTVWQTTHTNPYGFTSSTLVCTGRGASSVSVPVSVSRDGASWVVRADTGDMVLRLADASAGHPGSMVGSATDGSVSVTVNDGGPLQAPAVLPPGAASAATVGGRIEGAVRFTSSQGEQSCSANAWTLSRR